MADHAARVRRLADRIRVIVAQTLELKIKDPRLGFVTITDVRVTNDLREATVFYTVLGDEAARRDSAAALASAKGVLRSEVGAGTGVRFTPTLEFVLDSVPDTARAIDELLAAAAAADAEVAARAMGAQYAGEADPYRAPREPEDLESEELEAEEAAEQDLEQIEAAAGRSDDDGDEPR